MQTAANNNLLLTVFSSFKQLADSPTAIRLGGFYQQMAEELIKERYKKQALGSLAPKLIALAHRAYTFRRMDIVEQVAQVLMNLPLSRDSRSIGRYYHSFTLRRRGQVAEARALLDRLAGEVPHRYMGRVIMSLAGLVFDSSDFSSALPLYMEAGRAAATATERSDLFTLTQVQRQIAVLKSIDGDHIGAVAHLEDLRAIARISGSQQPPLWFDYLNSLAVELCAVGRLEEARNICQIVLASPFASAYPEWRETRDEIELREWRASRSVVALSQITDGAVSSQATAGASAIPAPPEDGNLVRLPMANRDESLAAVEEAAPPRQTARVLSLQEWKEKMAKQSNGDPQDKKRRNPTTAKAKESRLEEMEKLGTRGLLLRAMEMLGDERLSDDQLRRVLIILEGLEPDENSEA